MRLSKAKTAQNRREIIDAASRLFRERGYDAVGLTDLMQEAGFTHGGFYNHFVSKEALATEAYRASFDHYLSSLISEFEKSTENGEHALHNFLESYLSTAHRDDPAHGCPGAALVVDAMRRDESTQNCYAKNIEAYIAIFMRQLSAVDRSESEAELTAHRVQALSLLTQVVGALTLSRAVAKCNPALSSEILKVARVNINISLKE
jgi:TetR/AcrR family transcriptional repressor of nem operon